MKLIQHVLHIRGLIQKAFENRFDRLGLRADGLQPIDTLPGFRREERIRLSNIVADHNKNVGSYSEAREEAIRECVFTLFNRIAAIKVMEDRELFPEIIRRRTEHAGRSFAHNAWLEEHPDERRAAREGLKHFLADKFAELSVKLPIFKAEYPYSLMPTADELFQIIEAFNAVEQDPDCGLDIWKGDDILGWLYENFNAVEKQAHKDSGDKTEYHKVSLQSQVYTPKWVVKFLVDNTLVKLYLEMYPDSTLRSKYLVANAPEPSPFAVTGRERKKIEDLKLIDPGMGSGNFLLYAFEVFYDLYQNQNEQYNADYSNRDIPRLILENNLYGLDLDERAAQLTQISLYIKAWTLGGRRFNKPSHLNVVSTHFTLPEFDDIQSALLIGGKWNEAEIKTLRKIWEDLRNAYKFGSLIRVEEIFDQLLSADYNGLFAQEWEQDLFSFKRLAIDKLRDQLAGVTNNPYSLSKVTDALTYLEILLNKFDVAVSNPPYTDSADFGAELKAFVEENYKKPYKFNSNLYAAFNKRCCELTTDDGKIGMIHPMTFMYIKTFEDMRKFMLDNTHISLFVEYGLSNLFGTVMVDPAFYTLEKGNHNVDSVFISLDQYTRTPEEKNKKSYCLEALQDIVQGNLNKHVYHLPQSKLKGIKSYPFIYWISDEFREKFGKDSFNDILAAKKGLGTENIRFFRFWWEISKDEISQNYEVDKKKWVFHLKGGPYNKWYGNIWLVIKWENEGYEIKHHPSLNLRNPDTYFKQGIGCSLLSSKGCSFRYQPTNCIYDSTTRSIFFKKDEEDIYYYLALLNSKTCTYILDCLNSTVATNSDDIHRIPIADVTVEQQSMIHDSSLQNVNIKKELCKFSIIEPLFQTSPISSGILPKESLTKYYTYENALLTQVLLNEAIINETVFDIYQLSEHDKQMVLDKEGVPVGALPVSAEAKTAYQQWLSNNTEFAPSEELMRYVDNLPIAESADRIDDFEVLYQSHNDWEEFCIRHQCNPIEAWYQHKQQGVLPPQRTQALAFELLTDVIRSVLAKDDDGVVPIVANTGEEQLAVRIEAELIERGYQPAHISQLFALLGMSLDKYLSDRFFAQLSDHLNLFMYLPKTPFIWHITSGEHHALELYVSIYRWSRDTLYRLKSVYAGNREDALKDRLSLLEAKTDANAKIEAEQVRLQLRELKAFCDKVDDLLASGYDPKLDDGVGKNIAPLQKRKMISYDVLNAGQLKKYLNADW
ncbi:MAG: BREX-1 system adenine-specific DNA-methyltransferase PglX [Muribaculaceae bacterium]|nr:BREX-1 system adenine-specific DNA-methyltransferase PglX [Muribaculaceae bacterium]